MRFERAHSQQTIAALLTENGELRMKYSISETAVATLRTENDGLLSKLSVSDGALGVLRSENDGLRSRLAISENAFATLRAENDGLRSNLLASDKALDEVERRYADEADQHARVQTRLKQARSENVRWSALAEEFAVQMDAAESTRAKLKAVQDFIEKLT
jgi:chromosome segregation ATPase